MTDSLVVPARFSGPPNSANGGYVCGRIASYVAGPATVTLRSPPPLVTPMAVEQAGDGSVRILDGGTLIAEGAAAPDILADVPDPVSVCQARAAGASCRLRARPAEHPFPTCFVCGPERAPGDGMRIMVGPVEGRSVAADVWYPDDSLADSAGVVRSEFVWAALDCTGGVGALAAKTPDGPPFVLGRLSARQLAPVTAGEPHVAMGWRAALDGRKLAAGSALFTANGQPVAVARATWIRRSE